ncbi:MAG TPA: ATP-binding protein [Anaeromyxobacteraceae bacterium]|nr:ATP-binding protein [Anaeromyxobacteraceae bacterium]
MRTSLGTAWRLFLAFALLVSTFAVASGLTLLRVRETGAQLAGMRQHEEDVRLALELASAVRDQYAHQAHTIILGNASHLPFYEEAAGQVRRLTSRVRAHAVRPDEQEWVGEIERATAALDRVFRERIVPAVLARDHGVVQDEHDRAQLLVTRIQERVDRLVERRERSIDEILRGVEASQDSAVRWTLVFVVVAPLLAALVGAYVLRSVALPVRRLQEGAERIARGDLDGRIDVHSRDEFGVLAGRFNEMTAALKAHQERLVQSEKLAGIGRLAAGVAHEINNPLAAILGYARLLRRRAEGPLADDLGIIEDEALHAKRIVDDLLDLSRPLAAEPVPVDLRALCDDAVARLRETSRLDAVEVSVSGTASVDGSPQKLRQVVLNLIRNAAEAAGAGGRVDVEVESLPQGARVAVQDSGPGLSPEARARLFEPFFTTKDDGTGLGLAVSRGIARSHGGDIEAASPPGGGARFTVRLPQAPPGRV